MSAASTPPLARMQESITFDIPYIFSLTVNPEQVPEGLREHVAFINQRLKLFLHIEQGKIEAKISVLNLLNEQLNAKFSQLAANPEASMLIAHINFMKAYLIFKFGSPPDLDGLRAYCGDYALPHPDLYWYRAVANILLVRHGQRFNNEMLSTWIDVLAHLRGEYKHVFFSEILRFLDLYSETFYVDAALLLRLKRLCSDVPEVERIVFPALASDRRHRYVERLMSQGPHADFFNAHIADLTPTLPKPNEPRTLIIERGASAMTFTEAAPSQLTCNRYDLLRYVSQLVTLRQPEPVFFVLNLTEAENQDLNRHMVEGLTRAGFLSSEGMVIQKKIFINPNAEPLVFSSDYLDCLLRLLNAFTLPGKTISVTMQQVESCAQSMLNSFREIANRRNFLSRYLPINALFLFRQTVLSIPRPYPIVEMDLPEAKLTQTVAMLDDCLEHAAKIKATLTAIGTFDPRQHHQVFVSAEGIAAALFASKRNLIIQMGTPVKDLRKKSEHAFYALIEFLEQAGTPHFRIVIFNGGPGLSMHRRDATLHPSEFVDKSYGCYHPVASKLLPLTLENQLFLQHYLYQAFSLAYRYCPDDDTRFKAMGENVYLGPKDGETYTFYGYGAYTRTEIFREAIAQIYRAQLSANCTLHNLKMALKYALGMNQIEFGVFEDLLLLGAREILDKVLSVTLASAADAVMPSVEGDGSGLVGFDAEDFSGVAMAFGSAVPGTSTTAEETCKL